MLEKIVPKILLVEDEPNIAFNIDLNLKMEGFEVVLESNGLDAVESFHTLGPFDLIILDIMLPDLDGFEIARTIRKTDPVTGILFLSARASENDILEGLKIGADDYITKPFSLKELLLRVKRMAQRSGYLKSIKNENLEELSLGEFLLNLKELTLKSSKGQFTLTTLEANVMSVFLKNSKKILTRDFLLENAWGIKGTMETRTVDNFVRRLRQYIETNPSKPIYLESIRGKGYRFNCE